MQNLLDADSNLTNNEQQLSDFKSEQQMEMTSTTMMSIANATISTDIQRIIHYPREATIFAAFCSIVFIIVGVTGNLVTILALGKSRKLRNATTAFVISLCVADLLFCAINLPLTASRYIHEDWMLGDTLCELFPFFFYGNVAASLMSMTAITINRLVLINFHNVYDKMYQKRNVILMIGLFWVFSFGIMMPPLIRAWGQLGYHPETFSCTILSLNGKSPKKFLFVLGFLLPCLVIAISYSCIFYRVRSSGRAVISTGQHLPLPSGDATNSNQRQKLSGQFRRDEIRLTRLMLIIFCSFLICFLPLMIVNVFDSKMRYPFVHVIASILSWLSSAINPFIYAILNRQYRQAYLRLFYPNRTVRHRTGHSTSRTGSACSSTASKTVVSDIYLFNAVTNQLETKTMKNGH